MANIVTCLQLSGISVPKKFNIWYDNAVKRSQDVAESLILPENAVYVLSNNTLYPLALYTSFQLAEFFGITAVAHKLEEFCHSPIFGLKNHDTIWTLGQNETRVHERLVTLGFSLSYYELYNSDPLTQLFESVFFIQSLILLLAQKYGFTELQYIMMKNVLDASSDIIYDQIN